MSLDITVTDMFCGAGGSTTGCVQAGATVITAINHWDRALKTHAENYPKVKHIQTDLQSANPRRFKRSNILVASPECTSHTLAKGEKRKGQGQPELWEDDEPNLPYEAQERSRCTMWTPLDWAECHSPEAVILENVVDAHLWRPFPAWLQAWKSLGYEYEIVYLNSMFAHPTPQSRDRMYFVATKKDNPRPNLSITPLAYCDHCEKDVQSAQSWKNPLKKHGKYKQQYVYCCPLCARVVVPYYYAAANAIDWSLPIERIGDRERPLAPKTRERIAYGLSKFARSPFSVDVTKTSDRVRALYSDAFATQTTTNGLSLVLPFLMSLNHPGVRTTDVHEQPFPTQTAYDDQALVVPPFIAEMHGTSHAREITEPLATFCAGGTHHALIVPPFVLDHLGEYRPRSIEGPLSTVCAGGNHQSLVVPPSWLMTYYNHGQMCPTEQAAPTVTTLERHALVTSGELPGVDDCGFRMLTPQEIKLAMAFPSDYIVTGTRREQVKQLGNAVTAPVMRELMKRVMVTLAA